MSVSGLRSVMARLIATATSPAILSRSGVMRRSSRASGVRANAIQTLVRIGESWS